MMNHLGTKVLETPRLILRPFTAADAPAVFRNYTSDPEVTKYLRWQAHTDEAASLEYMLFLEGQYPDLKFYDWAIVPKDLGEPIGSISVVGLVEEVDQVILGWCIGKNWWHRGITSEAAAEVIRFFFEEVGANRIEAEHDVRNPHSGGVMKKCGMRYEGTHRQAARNTSGLCDVSVYAILKEDWLKGRET